MKIIEQVIAWNRDAGNTTDEINVRQSALYLGLQCEELAEKLEAAGFELGHCSTHECLIRLSRYLKLGSYDWLLQKNIRYSSKREKMLDADIDLIVVSIGAAMSQGADVAGAIEEGLNSNESKRDLTGKLMKDANGKIIKGPNYFSPNLEPFVRK